MPEKGGYYFDLNDWRNSRSVRKMSWQSRALYREVLDEIWTCGSIPSKVEEIAELVKMPLNDVILAWPAVQACLIPCSTNPDELTSERMEQERARRRKLSKLKAKVGRSGGLAKASNALAGATTLLSTDVAKTRQEQDKASTTAKFDLFWREYPKKVGKAEAWKAWNRIRPDQDLYGKILSKIGEFKNSQDWRKDNGQFIPHPATWLNQGRWDDEVTIAASAGRLDIVV